MASSSTSPTPICRAAAARGTTAARLRLRALAARASTPTGPEWEKAKDGFAPFLEEGAATAFESRQSGCQNDVFKAKAALDADWTNRANTYLADHGLQVEVCAFYVSDGKSSTPHLFIQFSKPA